MFIEFNLVKTNIQKFRAGDHLSCIFVAIWNLKKRLDAEGRFDVMRTCKDLHDMKKNAFTSNVS